jgi:hypothetical protein
MDPAAYGPLSEWLVRSEPMSLGPGEPRFSATEIGEATTWENLRRQDPRLSSPAAAAIRSAVLLYQDLLEPSHEISQGLTFAEGSFLHGIMHRREGDYSNAKYWFRRVGGHPVWDRLAELPVVGGEGGRAFDPMRFVDRVQKVIGSESAEEKACQAVQEAEWWLLFVHLWKIQ